MAPPFRFGAGGLTQPPPPFAITDDELRDLGFILANDYGADPTGNPATATATTLALNNLMFDSKNLSKPAYFHENANYVVNDTIKCGTWKVFQRHEAMGGGKGSQAFGGTRPRIILSDGSTGFETGQHPVVCWRHFDTYNTGGPLDTWPTPDPMDQTFPFGGLSADLFTCSWENIDITTGANLGAVGLYAPAAQRCFISDIHIDATGGAGGVWGMLGRNSPIMNLTVTGGVIQLNSFLRSGEGSSGVCIAGLTLIGDSDTVAAYTGEDTVPFMVVGFDIFQVNDNPIFTTNGFASATGFGQHCFVDGKVEIGSGADPIFSNPVGKTVYLRNVWCKGSSNLIKSESEATITTTGEWGRIDEYSYTDQRTTNGSFAYTTRSMIDGVINTTPERVKVTTNNVGAPAVDFVARHIIDTPRIDSGPYERIDDHGAEIDQTFSLYEFNRDNLVADSIAAIDSAVTAAQAAGHNRVVIPRGVTYIGSELVPHKDTILIGVCRASIIATHGSWRPLSKTYMIRTADDASGTCHLSHFMPHHRTRDGPGGSPSTPFERDHFSWVEWRTGKNSSSIMYHQGREFMDATWATHPQDHYAFSGNAGGKHYARTESVGRNFGHLDSRNGRFTNTSQPLHVYGVNQEISKAGSPDALWNYEIQNCSNIRLYGCKREGDAGSTLINDSTNIGLYGYGRQAVDFGTELHSIIGDSDDIIIAPSTQDRAGVPATSKGNPHENVTGGGGTFRINFPEGCSYYRRGTPDDAAATI